MSGKPGEAPQQRSLASALNEAQSIIEAAENRAAELKRAAEGAFEESKRAGYQTGYQQGLRDAAGTAVRLIHETANMSARLSEEAARLAIAICGNVIAEHVQVDPTLVKKIAERALQQSVIGDTITIVCHPEDRAVLIDSLSTFQRLAGGGNVSIEVNAEIARGGCLVRTEFGEVDASLPTLLESIALHLGIPTR